MRVAGFLSKDINQDRHLFIISSYDIKICECVYFKIYTFICVCINFSSFPGGSVVKIPSVNTGDASLVLELGRSPGEGMATHSSILAWEIPWTEEPSGL